MGVVDFLKNKDSLTFHMRQLIKIRVIFHFFNKFSFHGEWKQR